MASNDLFVNAGYWFTHTNTQFPASKIDANLFTHLFCAHAGLNSQTYELSISDSQKLLIHEFSKTVKQNNPELKTLLSIGGDDAKAERFAAMAASFFHRAAFVRTTIAKAREGNFDGLDLQWLYPSSVEDMANFETLIIECHNAIIRETTKSSLPKLILVATVFYSPHMENITYPTQVMIRTLDWVNVIAYDIFTPASSSNETGPSSAFFNPRRRDLCGSFGIKIWIEVGLHSKMMVFGIPFHGWAWKLNSSENHQVFSAAHGAAQGEDISMEGLIEYRNVKKFIAEKDANNVALDQRFAIAYTYSDSTWIAYEDEETIKLKISSVKMDLELLGYFASNIAADDENLSLANTASDQWRKKT
ncbi:oviduct-specific glycoprotein-like [Momordica charantia]|uniref:Oviduct-specific glycoprotein-like n=1 Tax=Momordica charantia TaxID=3673 RepID=A0A6J1CQ39_MOMCH|nr:oviduct-specific glycoprotein-like [Momordica charantia]